jgi:hypothetical protein
MLSLVQQDGAAALVIPAVPRLRHHHQGADRDGQVELGGYANSDAVDRAQRPAAPRAMPARAPPGDAGP